jgi:VCBS repeat-containing protein
VGGSADVDVSLWIADKSTGEIGDSIGSATTADEKWWTWEIDASDVPNGIFDSSLFDFGKDDFREEPYLGPASGPRAKNYNTGLVIEEGDIRAGLNFGNIYSELIKVKDYRPTADYPGYIFSAKDFIATEVQFSFGSKSRASLQDAGISLEENGDITIDTNSLIYQNLYQGERQEVHVAFSVTDDNNRSDNGLVSFEVIGAGPKAKDYDSGLIIEENTIQSGLSFGTIYSELVRTKDYEPSDVYSGYTFSSKDFEAEEVIFSSGKTVSLSQAGLAIKANGDITIDTNVPIYQTLSQGDLEQASVIFTVTDNKNFSDKGSVTFSVAGKNDTPMSIMLSASTFDENISLNSVVARLHTLDQDSSDSHTYSLVLGHGDTDNKAFTIDGDELKINTSPDYEAKDSYSIRVQTKDSGGLTFENSLTLSVNNLDDEVDPRPYQEVFTTSDQISFTPGSNITIPLQYNTSDGELNLSGLKLNVHYDSSVLTPTAGNNGVIDQLSAAINSSGILADTEDLDNNPKTDSMIQMVWGTFDASFPDADALPATIATLGFETAAGEAIDPLTGLPLTTVLTTSASETAPGYGFFARSTTLTAQTFNLDVDGDDQVTALGDGLMIIRKLFGATFAGDALTNKAISPDATRTTDEIHAYIEKGIASGVLDVDQDNKTTALGDGLMIIRHLFGATFSGSALTNKAISPDSLYADDERPWEAVTENIDKLYPSIQEERILPPVVVDPDPIGIVPLYGVGTPILLEDNTTLS